MEEVSEEDQPHYIGVTTEYGGTLQKLSGALKNIHLAAALSVFYIFVQLFALYYRRTSYSVVRESALPNFMPLYGTFFVKVSISYLRTLLNNLLAQLLILSDTHDDKI